MKSNFGDGPPHRQAHATEYEEVEEVVDEEGEMEPEIEEPENQAMNLETIIQNEAEVLAAEIEEAEANGVDADTLDELEAGVEGAAEALITR